MFTKKKGQIIAELVFLKNSLKFSCSFIDLLGVAQNAKPYLTFVHAFYSGNENNDTRLNYICICRI